MRWCKRLPGKWTQASIVFALLMLASSRPGLALDLGLGLDGLWYSAGAWVNEGRASGDLYAGLRDGRGFGGGVRVGKGHVYGHAVFNFQDLDIADDHVLLEVDELTIQQTDFYYWELGFLLGARTGRLLSSPLTLFGEVGVAWGHDHTERYYSDGVGVIRVNETRPRTMLAAEGGVSVAVGKGVELFGVAFARYRESGGQSGYRDPFTGTYYRFADPPGVPPGGDRNAIISGMRIGAGYRF